MGLLAELGGDAFIDWMAGAEMGEADFLLGRPRNYREKAGYRNKQFAEGYLAGYDMAKEDEDKTIAECEKLYKEGKLR